MSEPTLNFCIQTRQVQFSVPTELIKKNFKLIQKQVEKTKKQVLDEIAKIKKDPTLSPQKKLAAVQKLIKTFEQLQKKLVQAKEKDEDYRLRLQARARRISELKDYTLAPPTTEDHSELLEGDRVLDLHNGNLINWFREEANLLILDYLLKSNTSRGTNLGIKLMRELEADATFELSKIIDHDVHDNFNKVFNSINEDHDLESITAWYNDNRNTLKKVNSNLQFKILFCKYLSMIEKGDVGGAIAFCKTNLAPYADRKNYTESEMDNYEKNLKRLTGVGAPLVFMSLIVSRKRPGEAQTANGNPSWMSILSTDASVSNASKFELYNHMLMEDNWQDLSKCFTEDYTKVYGISQTYPLLVYLSAGLSSLKTKSCFCYQENTIFRGSQAQDATQQLDSNSLRDLALRGPNQYYKRLKKINQCPVCSPELFELSRNLPYAQLITSIFNNPFKLPNGNIYPFDKLLNPPDKTESDVFVRNGRVKDPLTQEVFFIDDCVRVYPA